MPFAHLAVPAVGRVKQVFLSWDYLIHFLDSGRVVGRLVLKYRGAKVSASGRCGSVEVTDTGFKTRSWASTAQRTATTSALTDSRPGHP